MRKGKCVKCSSNEIFRIEDKTNRWIRVSFLNDVWFVDYVCAQCGYVEAYIEDSNKLNVIKQKCKKV